MDKDRLVKEQRLSEVITKDYQGLEGKFGTILKFLGSPVVSQDSANYHATPWENVYDIVDDNEMPTDDLDMPICEIGRVFDGLKFGAHLEITFLKEGRMPDRERSSQWHTDYIKAENVLTVSHRGYPVYREVEGELDCFVPGEWESDIEKIYKLAIKVKSEKKVEFLELAAEEMKSQKIGLLAKLRARWGI